MKRKKKIVFAIIKVCLGITLIILGVELIPGLKSWIKYVISSLMIILLIINSFHGNAIHYNYKFGVTFGIIIGLIIGVSFHWLWGLIFGITFCLIFSANLVFEKSVDFWAAVKYLWYQITESIK